MTVTSRRRRHWKELAWLTKRHLAVITGVILSVVIVLLVALGPFIFTADPIAQDIDIRLTPPFLLGGNDPAHLLGTDQLGRDVLSRLLHGARLSLVIAWMSVLASAAVGIIIGLASGYYRGITDELFMRVAEAEMAFPFVVLALLLLSVLSSSPGHIIAVFIVVGWPIYSKIVRGLVLSLREEEFIIAAHAMGAHNWRIMALHLLPNLLPSVFVLCTLQFSVVIFTEAGLSFIGVGIQPPTPSWGMMLAEGRQYISTAWWLPTWPGLALMFTVLAANLVGDGLQDALNPRRRVGMA